MSDNLNSTLLKSFNFVLYGYVLNEAVISNIINESYINLIIDILSIIIFWFLLYKFLSWIQRQ